MYYRPWRSLSSSFDPDVTWIISDRFWWNSVAVVKPMGTSLAASAYENKNELLANHKWMFFKCLKISSTHLFIVFFCIFLTPI